MVVKNKLIPFNGFLAMNILGIVFLRKDYLSEVSEEHLVRTMNHETIHTAQMIELLFVGFYVIYLLEWLYRLVFHTKTAYRGISFEREAYGHEDEPEYLETRKHFAQWRKN